MESKLENTWQEALNTTLSNHVLEVLKEQEFIEPTPIQRSCIPIFLGNKDVAAEAVTGSGKTLAFVIPILEKIQKLKSELKKHSIFSVIITPTRELAIQISDVLQLFLKKLNGITANLFIGGESPQINMKNFAENGGHILIATPGRLEALLEETWSGCNFAACIKSTEILILDEADRLLEMGFTASINTILSFIPKQRRTGLFSATQTEEVEHLIRAGLRNPVRISVKEKTTAKQQIMDQKTPSSLQNNYMILEPHEKFNQLMHFLKQNTDLKIMVFFSTCASVDYFSKAIQIFLKNSEVLYIHGKMKKKRNQVFAKFRTISSGILICTDVMARGIDVPDVNWVIQFDPPSSANSFVHRCGRTARIGNAGSAMIFLLPEEDSYVKFLEINQKAPLQQLSKEENVYNFLPKLQKLALKDRAMLEKGSKAFVSFVQSYAKHECSMIFRLKDLNFGKLGTGYGLLRLPKMPELKGMTFVDFTPVDVDFSAIPYKDKQREKQRKKNLQKVKDDTKKPKMKRPPRSIPWSNLKNKKEQKKKRREQKEMSKKRKFETSQEDIDDLDNDLKLMKRLKKGKMSLDDFDREFVGEDD